MLTEGALFHQQPFPVADQSLVDLELGGEFRELWPILTFSDTVTCYGSEGEEWKNVGDTVTS